MSAGLFKVVDSKSSEAVVRNKSFGEALRIVAQHNSDRRNVSTYKMLAQ
jgi:hypothetical protein